MSDFLRNLKPGDTVAIVGTGLASQAVFASVTRKTPSGQIILDNNRRFNPRGWELGVSGKYNRCVLTEITEGLKDRVKRDKLVRLLSHRLHHLKELDTPTLERIAVAIGEAT